MSSRAFLYIISLAALLFVGCSDDSVLDDFPVEPPAADFQWTRAEDMETHSKFLRNFGLGYSYDAVRGSYCDWHDIRCQVINRYFVEFVQRTTGDGLIHTSTARRADINQTFEYSMRDYIANVHLDLKEEMDIGLYKKQKRKRQNFIEDGVQESYYFMLEEKQMLVERYLSYASIMERYREQPDVLTLSFRNAVEHLKETYEDNIAAVDSFINVWGTHVIVSAQIGGSLNIDLMNYMWRWSDQAKIDEVKAYLEANPSVTGTNREILDAYLDTDIEPNDTYPNGSYSYVMDMRELDNEAITTETDFVQRMLDWAVAGGYTEGSDITSLIMNPAFEEGTKSWTIENGSMSVSNVAAAETKYVAYSNGKTCLSQTITDLQPGIYEIRVNAYYRAAGANDNLNQAAFFFANNNKVYLPTRYEGMLSTETANKDRYEPVYGEECHRSRGGRGRQAHAGYQYPGLQLDERDLDRCLPHEVLRYGQLRDLCRCLRCHAGRPARTTEHAGQRLQDRQLRLRCNTKLQQCPQGGGGPGCREWSCG